ncbi:hypothetical protein BDR03DRAFT_948899 [Suillus americanus]|nr:hypothetical protein BDR03DRAFT_948899 [Suillus americanus]
MSWSVGGFEGGNGRRIPDNEMSCTSRWTDVVAQRLKVRRLYSTLEWCITCISVGLLSILSPSVSCFCFIIIMSLLLVTIADLGY